ncbi:MAG: ABC-F family ATP-binding cassette domain-containing protein [Lachnospiraceae bacterium]|nr:ABC-F family ATP-binding cassette domain-containing protein [Lachnospiraceae bacterium]MCI9373218.1 ABC-F family ATP-binding cassette domain-containing protein [Lachnospiraceae bacterium]
MILSVNHIHKSFLEVPVLQDVSFHIEAYDKAAIVGINGAGKTTLLRIIMGELSPDEGIVTVSRDTTIGYLSQHQAVSSENTIYDELLSVRQNIVDLERRMRSVELQMKNASEPELSGLMEHYANLTHAFESANGYAYRSELTGVLKGLGFEENEFSKSVDTLSGGQKTRVALGKLLLQKPDLIILDEPTNHLDMSSITWLETYLLNYKGAVILVSHDRYFLDRITGKIIELDNTKAAVFTGNYSAYAAKKEMLRIAQYNAYMNQQREIRHQEAVIEKLRSFNREKSIKRAESREKMLDKIDVLEKPTEVRSDMKLHLEPRVLSGNDVLHVENIAKSFGSLTLFKQLSFDIRRGEHVAIIGDNGTGKTTILKMINELLFPDSGLIRLGTNVEIGYYDQEHHVLHPEKTLFEEISDDYPYLNNTEIRNTLAAFLFTGDDVFKKIESLSGGERGRLSLAKLMLSESNFLILDEPTNHLDIMSKEILEDAINSYTGTVLYVSHDRYFINRTASRILDLDQQTLTEYHGNYEYYLEKKNENASGTFSSASAGASFAPNFSNANAGSAEKTDSESKQDWKNRKEQQAAIRKRENEIKKCETAIESLENRNTEIDLEMAEPSVCTDVAKLQELVKEKERNEAELTELYEKWELLSDA